MKTIQTTIYECEHCKRYYKMERFAILHEDRCVKNPDNIPKCYGCEHLKKERTELKVEIQQFGEGYGICYGEEMRVFNLLKCTKKNVFIIPIISHKKGNCFEPNLLDEIEQIVAPLDCEDYEPEQYV